MSDSDKDGTPDCVDECPFFNGTNKKGLCPCGYADTDTDGDGVLDCYDRCPYLASKYDNPGVCGCQLDDTDEDGDGVPICKDSCPQNPNKTQPGVCGCNNTNTNTSDSDKDGVPVLFISFCLHCITSYRIVLTHAHFSSTLFPDNVVVRTRPVRKISRTGSFLLTA